MPGSAPHSPPPPPGWRSSRTPPLTVGSVGLESCAELCHVNGVSGEDERAQALCDDGQVGVDDIGGRGLSEPATDRHRLVEGVDVEMADCSGQVGLPCRLAPHLGENRVGGVQLVASFGCPLDEGPESRVQVFAIDDEWAGVDDQRPTP